MTKQCLTANGELDSHKLRNHEISGVRSGITSPKEEMAQSNLVEH
ncbi:MULTISPECIES: hypothetical protein [unclassified Agarivorans]|nr:MULTISPECIES: hypothetical protein [unclassified Agarivorans]MDO6684132.1 hypothetical protein [Agarivorans sp. 3_MG-2023]MDO6714134.1 hypothetical protein [Agarivorans sp. 2_MG-2023]